MAKNTRSKDVNLKSNLNRNHATVKITLRTARVYMRITVHNSRIHNTAQNNSDNRPSYPPDNQHCLVVVYWRGGDLNQPYSDLQRAHRRQHITQISVQ